MLESLRSQIAELRRKNVKHEIAENLEALDKKLEVVEGGAGWWKTVAAC